MTSETLGENISAPEVTNISAHGLWVLVGDQELFLSYEDFPWFKEVQIGKIIKIEEPRPGHLYWPE